MPPRNAMGSSLSWLLFFVKLWYRPKYSVKLRPDSRERLTTKDILQNKSLLTKQDDHKGKASPQLLPTACEVSRGHFSTSDMTAYSTCPLRHDEQIRWRHEHLLRAWTTLKDVPEHTWNPTCYLPKGDPRSLAVDRSNLRTAARRSRTGGSLLLW